MGDRQGEAPALAVPVLRRRANHGHNRAQGCGLDALAATGLAERPSADPRRKANERKTLFGNCARGAPRRGGVAAPAFAQNEQFIPHLVYRTGAYAPNGIPFANGIADYYKLVNERDGGINGVKIVFEECDTGYATDRGVECYERLKGKGPTGAAYVIPLSTGITFALTEKAPIDKIPIISMGYGRSESRDGSVFQWNFPLLGTYWTAADILLQHIAKRKAGSTSSRARRSRWSITTRPTARSRSRCCRSARRCTASSRCSTR